MFNFTYLLTIMGFDAKSAKTVCCNVSSRRSFERQLLAIGLLFAQTLGEVDRFTDAMPQVTVNS